MKLVLPLLILLSSCASYSALDPSSGKIVYQKGDRATVLFEEVDGEGFGYADFQLQSKQDSIIIISRIVTGKR
jgi:hypothetical protein